ncbi:Ribonuclease R [Lactococcus cremoris]|nr:Ribonuclease R [Lactococcus cremoris]
MLPERLSNGICSLNPRLNRLTQSCVMEISPEGRVVNYQISQSIIKTTERMTYDAVNQMIAGAKDTLEKYAKIADSVKIMVEIHHILEAMRKQRGAIDFDTVEAKIIVNEKGLPIEIRKRSRGIAERMIESFMLEANETVATHFEAHGLPFIYRIHEQPKADRLQRFIDFAATFGMQIEGTSNGIDQKVLQAFMKKIKGQPGEMVLSTMLNWRRCNKPSVFSKIMRVQLWLAAENYTHFTSPIRRYPDLLVHRLIREIGAGKIPANLFDQKWEEKKSPENCRSTLCPIVETSSG